MGVLALVILVFGGVIWTIYVAATDIKKHEPPKGSNEPVTWSFGNKIRYTGIAVVALYLLITLVYFLVKL